MAANVYIKHLIHLPRFSPILNGFQKYTYLMYHTQRSFHSCKTNKNFHIEDAYNRGVIWGGGARPPWKNTLIFGKKLENYGKFFTNLMPVCEK